MSSRIAEKEALVTPTVPGTKCRCEGGLEWGGGLFVWFFFFVFLSSQWITHNPTEDLNNAFSPPSSGFSLSSSFSVPPLPHCLAEAAYSYNRAWLEGLATPSPQFQRAESWKEGGLGEGQGCRGKTSIQHSSVASDLHTCFPSPSSLLHWWGGNQHFKGETFSGRGKTYLALTLLISMINTKGWYYW